MCRNPNGRKIRNTTGGERARSQHCGDLTGLPRACMNDLMKTITLDEVAYERLKRWKRTPRDSFSSVVKRVVPDAGTAEAFMSYVEARGTDRLCGNEVMAAAIEEGPTVKEDPWTT